MVFARYRVCLLAVTVTLGLLFVIFQAAHPANFRLFSGVKRDKTCSAPNVLRDIVHLTEEVHDILNSLNLTNFLLYGSHWGAIRFGSPLPWDVDADLGVLGDRNYFDLGPERFANAFSCRGMRVTNNMAQKSSLKLDRASKVHVDVIVFFDYNGLMKRRGWEPLLLPLHFRLHHTFPTSLVQTPPALPELKFGHRTMPVPRNGKEIMHYLYRYDWWKNYKPQSRCKPVNFNNFNVK